MRHHLLTVFLGLISCQTKHEQGPTSAEAPRTSEPSSSALPSSRSAAAPNDAPRYSREHPVAEAEVSSTKRAAAGWEIEITTGLRASFFQPDGSSRPGTDWIVVFRRGPTEHKVIVRTYAPGRQRASAELETRAVFEHVIAVLDKGWDPAAASEAPDVMSIELSGSGGSHSYRSQ